jgi:uncharacterized protein
VEGAILWRRLDTDGHESAALFRRDGGFELAGTAAFAHEGQPCRLDYLVVCDARWSTRSGRVVGWLGRDPVQIEVTSDGAGRWQLDGRTCPDVAGALDVDLNFSPSTNLLPIRRLGLALGEEAEVRAAWLRFPSFTLEPLAQRYRRTGASVYRYESAGGRFVADLVTDAVGFVTRYPGFCEAVTGT